MPRYQFAELLEPDDEEPHRYNVWVPGCLTYGESIEDALSNAREAISVYVESLIADGEPVSLEGAQSSPRRSWCRRLPPPDVAAGRRPPGATGITLT